MVVDRARVLSSEHGVGSGVKVDGEPPLPALRPPPGAAVGQGVGWGPQGPPPAPPPTSAPFVLGAPFIGPQALFRIATGHHGIMNDIRHQPACGVWLAAGPGPGPEAAAAGTSAARTDKGGGRCRAPPSRFAPVGAAVGQGAGWGPQGSLPDPARLGPIYEKRRFQDVKPLCYHSHRLTNRRVNEVLKRSPRVTDHVCCS